MQKLVASEVANTITLKGVARRLRKQCQGRSFRPTRKCAGLTLRGLHFFKVNNTTPALFGEQVDIHQALRNLPSGAFANAIGLRAGHIQAAIQRGN